MFRWREGGGREGRRRDNYIPLMNRSAHKQKLMPSLFQYNTYNIRWTSKINHFIGQKSSRNYWNKESQTKKLAVFKVVIKLGFPAYCDIIHVTETNIKLY